MTRREQWRDAYRAAFLAAAAAQGWTAENAAAWHDEIAEAAELEALEHGRDAAAQAARDVEAISRDAWLHEDGIAW